MDSTQKIIERDKIAQAALDARNSGKRIVFTNGCFDLLHPGHVRLFEFCRSKGDFVIVALNTDKSVHRLKGDARPILPQRERARIIASLEFVDAVTYFDEDTPAEIIEEIIPDVLVKGGDYGPGEVVGEEFVNRRGGETFRFPIIAGAGTTDVIDSIVEKFGT